MSTSLEDELNELVSSILDEVWDVSAGRVVPAVENIGLGNDGVELDATMLYADLADSTSIVRHDREIAAELFKAFLESCTRILLAEDGYIRSFDGDRVMAVFVGDRKNTHAASAALKINYAFTKIIVPKFKVKHKVFNDGTLSLAHCVGVDASKVLVARTGIRDNNDLVWIGRAPNIAAKLSARRNTPYHSYITETVFDNMNKSAKLSHDGKSMWERKRWDELPSDIAIVYRSNFWRRP